VTAVPAGLGELDVRMVYAASLLVDYCMAHDGDCMHDGVSCPFYVPLTLFGHKAADGACGLDCGPVMWELPFGDDEAAGFMASWGAAKRAGRPPARRAAETQLSLFEA